MKRRSAEYRMKAIEDILASCLRGLIVVIPISVIVVILVGIDAARRTPTGFTMNQPVNVTGDPMVRAAFGVLVGLMVLGIVLFMAYGSVQGIVVEPDDDPEVIAGNGPGP